MDDATARAAKLKVYRTTMYGTNFCIGAFPSFAAFKRVTNASRDFTTITGNREEISVAMAKPGAVFLWPDRDPNPRWTEWTPPAGRAHPAARP